MAKKPKKVEKAKKSKNKGDVAHASPEVRRVRVADIVIEKDQFRDLDQKTVSDLAESFQEVGLMHLPTVCIKKPKDGSGPEKLHLIAGRHRLAAAQKLGWEFIDVIVVKRVERKNQMRRITENLHRNGLSKQEEGREIRAWLELRYAKESGQVAQSNDKGISQAAKHFNKSRRTIRRLIEAGAIKPEAAMALKEAGLDNNGQVLGQVARAKAEKQVAKIEEIVREREQKKIKSKAQKKTAKPTVSEDDEDGWSDTSFDKLKEAWDESAALRKEWANASAEDRQRFINEVLLADDNENYNKDEWDEAA